MNKSKFLLVSVCRRKIETKQFGTYEDARFQMMGELKEQFNNAYEDILEWDDDIYQEETYTNIHFGFSKTTAWADFEMGFECDWKIVEII